MTLPVFQSTKDMPPDVELLQLKDFIVRGEAPNWCVYVDNGGSYPYPDYAEAGSKFDSTPPEFGVSLVLWTRISTFVTFRRREATVQK